MIEHVHVATAQHKRTGNAVTPHHRHWPKVEGLGSEDAARKVLGEMFDSFDAGEALVRSSARRRRTIGGNAEVIPDQQVIAAASSRGPARVGQ